MKEKTEGEMVSNVEIALREASSVFELEKQKYQDEIDRHENNNHLNIKMIA